MSYEPNRMEWLAYWRVAVTLSFLAVAAALTLAVPVLADDGVDYWLTVFHNNDGESALLPSPAMEDGALGLEGGVACCCRATTPETSPATTR